MKILFASSEMVPFSKTGGLADVAGALPAVLARRGHTVWAITPYHRSVAQGGFPTDDRGITFSVPLGDREVEAHVKQCEHRGVTVFFIDTPEFFDRDGLYQTHGEDHPDNADRFAFFARAILETVDALDLDPDIIHGNDWQTALVPAFLKTRYAKKPWARAATLLTIHNLGYQGLFPVDRFARTGLPAALFDWRQFEFFGKVNFLKGGLAMADGLSTVSKRYAEEIRTEASGAGLHGILSERKNDLFGVVNGIDTTIWNPETDPHIAQNFSAKDLSGKTACRQALRREAGLADSPGPLFGVIGRLASQKGIDLLCDRIDAALDLGCQIVVLGTGDPTYHRMLTDAQARHPGQLRAFLSFDDALAHRIEAGADAFLMPSRYEPCGLNQMMSQRYGTVPVVRATGGLKDTVTDYDPASLDSGRATGFAFQGTSPADLLGAMARAVLLFGDPPRWRRLMANGMARDWSWDRSAAEYEAIYLELVRRRLISG